MSDDKSYIIVSPDCPYCKGEGYLEMTVPASIKVPEGGSWIEAEIEWAKETLLCGCSTVVNKNAPLDTTNICEN